MEIKRDEYLNKLIRSMGMDFVKVITGIRRCGKSYLLFNIFYDYLISTGVTDDHIIKAELDLRKNIELRNPDKLCAYIESKIIDDKQYYVFLDEIQMVEDFESVLNELMHIENTDIYVTGSNSKFLSSDIITEFRGRSWEIRIRPLSFQEYHNFSNKTVESDWRDYITFGGMPFLFNLETNSEKSKYLQSLFIETYSRDIVERYDLRYVEELDELTDILASSIGGLTNPSKLEKTFKTEKNAKLSAYTIKRYISYLEDAFIISEAKRYDVKGKRYINTPNKYYFSDIGLRNARLNFRQIEETHIMENIIYNELLNRGYSVDVGVVEINAKNAEGQNVRKQLEVDFVCNLASERIYVQSALSIMNEEKEKQEQNSLSKINDSFRKIIISKDAPTHYNQNGIKIINLFDFLLDNEL